MPTQLVLFIKPPSNLIRLVKIFLLAQDYLEKFWVLKNPDAVLDVKLVLCTLFALSGTQIGIVALTLCTLLKPKI